MLVGVMLGAGQLIAAESEVTGIFKGNDQPATLAFVSSRKGTPLRGQETIKLVFTEKDHCKDADAALKALFGDYGSALVIGIQPDGKVVTWVVYQIPTERVLQFRDDPLRTIARVCATIEQIGTRKRRLARDNRKI